jgi:hypothetical protein
MKQFPLGQEGFIAEVLFEQDKIEVFQLENKR